MPKQIPESELDAIKQAVRAYPEGASADDISLSLGHVYNRRTLQRRLALLVEKNQLILEGSGRATRYKIAPPIVGQLGLVSDTDSVLPVTAETYVPISDDGAQIKNTVRLPVQGKSPVGYCREFVSAYVPNQSFYLPKSMREHLSGIGGAQFEAMPAGTYVLQIYNRLLIDLTWNSSRLEGNTYSLLETERLLAAGEAAEGKNAFETQMILNHKAAMELMVNSASEVGFNNYTICNLHALLSDNLLSDPGACGRLRQQPFGIDGSTFHPLEGGELLRECFTEILQKVDAIQNPLEQAFFAMVHLPYLQPFDDVNKRTSRLAANIPLIRENLSPLSFVDVPKQAYIDGLLGVYELNRVELLRDVFVWAYERSCARYSAVRQSLGEPDAFRMQYRKRIGELVADIVRNCENQKDAAISVKEFAALEIEESDRERFIEVTETELMSLHEGNMARYRIRPSEFYDWRRRWAGS